MLKTKLRIADLMQKPEEMKTWFENKKKEFNALPED
jgi:hypothetical protein